MIKICEVLNKLDTLIFFSIIALTKINLHSSLSPWKQKHNKSESYIKTFILKTNVEMSY